MIAALQDEHSGVRIEAVRSLALTRGEVAVHLERMLDDPDALVRLEARQWRQEPS